MLFAVAGLNARAQSTKPSEAPKPVEVRPAAPPPQPKQTETAPRHEAAGQPEHTSEGAVQQSAESGAREEKPVEEHGPVQTHAETTSTPSTNFLSPERHPIFASPGPVAERTVESGETSSAMSSSSSSRTSGSTSTGTSTRTVWSGSTTRTSRDLAHSPAERQPLRPLDSPPSPEESRTVAALNARRAALQGINRAPIPEGRVHGSGGMTMVSTRDRWRFVLREDGTLASAQSPQATATFTSSGKIATFRTSSVTVENLAHGQRVMTVRRPDGTSVTRTGAHSGYVAREVARNGQRYSERTYLSYLSGNKLVRQNYLWMSYGGQRFWEYLPRHRYSPAFYEWLRKHRRWPVTFRRRWPGGPWLAYYQFYFVPAGEYDGVADWLADFVLGETLEDGYEMEQPDANADPASTDEANGGGQGIGEELKGQIADQVQQELDADETSVPVNEAMTAVAHLSLEMQAGHIFIVDKPMSVGSLASSVGVVRLASADDNCTLSPGDVIRATKPMETVRGVTVSVDGNEDSVTPAELEVVASQPGDCEPGRTIRLPLSALEEMENAMRARLDDGLDALAQQKGLEGLPAASVAVNDVVSAPGPLSESAVAGMLRAVPSQVDAEETEFTSTLLVGDTVPR